MKRVEEIAHNQASIAVQQKIRLSDEEILEIQEYFLTPGLHIIKVADVMTGRILLARFLEALGYYFSDKAVLSLTRKTIPEGCADIYTELVETGSLHDYDALQNYIASSFYYDFLAIEGTHELLNNPWFGRFEYVLRESCAGETTPIILFFYDSQ